MQTKGRVIIHPTARQQDRCQARTQVEDFDYGRTRTVTVCFLLSLLLVAANDTYPVSRWNEMKTVRSLKHELHPSIIPFYSFIITPSYALITM